MSRPRAPGGATDLGTCATRALNRSGQQKIVDAMGFFSWVEARAENRTRVTHFLEERFRRELKPAFQAWIATNPLTNADAPPNPFAMPQYQLAADAEAARCEREVAIAERESQRANNVVDAYILNSILFAVVLFFAGSAQSVHTAKARFAMLAFALVARATGLVNLARLPID